MTTARESKPDIRKQVDDKEVEWIRMKADSIQQEFLKYQNSFSIAYSIRVTHIVFNVRRPPPSHFGMTPKVGMLAPQEVRTIFMTFSGRCSRIPDDLVWLYSIYQLEITDEAAAAVKAEKFSTKTIRRIWGLHGSKDVANVLHLGCVFFHDSKMGRCIRRHTVRPVPELDEKGMLVEEDEYDPDLHDDQSENLPSANECDL